MSPYCLHVRELQVLRNRLVIAKQHVVNIHKNSYATVHTRTISLQIVRMLEEEIARKEKVIEVIMSEYNRDHHI